LAAVALVSGCGGDPGSLTGSGPGAPPDDGDPGGAAEEPDDPVEPVPVAPKQAPTFAETTLARARAWIAAGMPYCGGPNGGDDVICGGTCERDGAAESAEWDDYRSDCSGFVSWAWDLPAPGRVTKTFAPYDTEASVVISVDDLEPGDALNSGSHVMLFGGWVDEEAGKATILQESRCGTKASEKVVTFTPIGSSLLELSDGRQFHTIRYRGRKD
jgi:hypothetical protein